MRAIQHPEVIDTNGTATLARTRVVGPDTRSLGRRQRFVGPDANPAMFSDPSFQRTNG